MNHLESLANPVINHATLTSVLGSYARPNDKISELIAKHQLVPLKRGLYLIENSQQSALELIANHLHGPSYVSRHWALSYYGLLTEHVSVVTSMCIGRSRQSETARGSFHYQAIPASYYSVGIDSIQQDKIAFMMATPEKALADLLVSTRKLRIQSSSAMMNYLENGNIVNSVNYPNCDLGEASGAARITVHHKNLPNMIGQLTAILAADGHNISNMLNKSKGEWAYSMFDMEKKAPTEETIKKMEQIDGVVRVRVL